MRQSVYIMQRSFLALLPGILFALWLGILSGTAHAETAIGQNAVYAQSAVDSEGNLHIVYMSQGWAGSCYYMKYNGSTWVGPTYLPNSYPSWKPFTFPRIDVGPDGRAQVVYGVRTGDYPDDLLYLWYAKADDANGTSFSVQQLGDDGFRRGSYDIAVDESNQPHICYGKTNKYEPYWWNIIYRRTDGTEKVIDTGVDGSRVLKPAIAFENGLVHLTWYKQSPGTTNMRYAVDTPYGDGFPIEQLTNNSSGHQVESPDIATAPDGHAEIVYFAADWTGAEPHYEGLWLVRPGSAPVMLEPTYADIDHSNEDFPPNIRIDNDGDRYVGWSHYTWGESLYKINWEEKEGLSPYGNIAIAAGNGAYYVRTHGCPGTLYFQELDGGGPPNESPVALFDYSPTTGDITTTFSFDASDSYDPDNNLPLTYRWDWESDGHFDLIQEGVATAEHIFSYPGEYQVRLEVVDDLGASDTTQETLEVINHPPVAAFDAVAQGPLTIEFDASGSHDLEDGTSLEYSWDFEGTGDFERWTIFNTTQHVYDEPGDYDVVLRVRDQLEAIDDTTMTVYVPGLPPEPPESLVAIDFPDDQGGVILVTWGLSPDDTLRGAITNYFIRRTPEGQSEYVEFTVAAGDSSYHDSVSTGESFLYSIAAYDGESYSEWVDAEEPAQAIDNLAPEAITGLAAVIEPIDSAWRVLLTWTPSVSEDVVTQSIYRSVGDGQWVGLATIQPTEAAFANTIYEVGTYFYRVGSSDFEHITFSDSVDVEAAGTEVTPGLPTALKLASVSPNPAKDLLCVRFGVPTSSSASLSLHDISGRRISLIRFDSIPPGWHNEIWKLHDEEGNPLPGGAYVIRLCQGNSSITTPLVITR